MYHSQRPYGTTTSHHAYVNQQPSNQTSFNFNQYIVELLRWQTELTHSAQWFHQQTTDALNNIAKSSSFQENQHFINDIPIFKAKYSQFISLCNIIIITSWELYSTQRCSFIYTKDCWMAVKAKRPQLKPLSFKGSGEKWTQWSRD